MASQSPPRRRDAKLPPPEVHSATYVIAALAALGVGTVAYWLYLLASLVV